MSCEPNVLFEKRCSHLFGTYEDRPPQGLSFRPPPLSLESKVLMRREHDVDRSWARCKIARDRTLDPQRAELCANGGRELLEEVILPR
jgi:hypothetical protein